MVSLQTCCLSIIVLFAQYHAITILITITLVLIIAMPIPYYYLYTVNVGVCSSVWKEDVT